MTDREDVERLVTAQRRAVEMAREDLAELFQGFNLSRPELVRDALVSVVPIIVRDYGLIAAAAAAEWYE